MLTTECEGERSGASTFRGEVFSNVGLQGAKLAIRKLHPCNWKRFGLTNAATPASTGASLVAISTQ